MRIYILTNTNVVKNNWLTKLEPYLGATRQFSYLWSEENGLLQYEQQKFYRIRIKDVQVIKTLVGAYPATLDASEFIREEECFQIAPRSYSECIETRTYRLPQQAPSIEWIFEYKNGELHDNYFYSATELNTNEILDFLKL
jgi:hypothetical protein